MTLKELSKITGYSPKTISRVINSPELVKEETRLIIQKAIDKYNYQPNRMAQALVQNHYNNIYLYMPEDLESTHPFVSQLVSGIVETLGEAGFGLLLRRTWYQNEPSDAIILVGLTIDDDKRLKELSKKKPVILFGHSEIDVSWFDVNNYLGSYMMTEEVIKRGFKNISYIAINEPKRFVNDRIRGHLAAIEDSPDKNIVNNMYKTSNLEVNGYELALKILKEKPETEVIVCASDYLAIGVLRAANKLNIKVPEQLSITGFDGLGFENLTYPSITTIRQPIHEIGKELGKQALNMVNKKQTDKITRYYKPSLIINKTLGEKLK